MIKEILGPHKGEEEVFKYESAIFDLEFKLNKAVEALRLIDETISWEINPSNYDHQEVCDMNTDWCMIGNTAIDTLEQILDNDA